MNHRRVLVLSPRWSDHLRLVAAEEEAAFDPAGFNALAEAMARPFSNWVERFWSMDQRDADFWASPLGDIRDAVNNGFFRDLCYLIYALQRIKDQAVDVVCCACPYLREALLQNGAPARMLSQSWEKKPRRFLGATREALAYLANSIGASTRRKAHRSSGVVGLFDFFLFRDSIRGGAFAARHFGSFPRHLNDSWRLYPFSLERLSRQERRRLSAELPQQFLFKEDTLSLADHIWVAMHFWRQLRSSRPTASFDDLALDCLLAKYTDYPDYNERFLALQEYRAALRLPKLGYKIGFSLAWFENQRVDRLQHLGLRTSYPAIRIAGYEIPYLSAFGLHLRPTVTEAKAGLLPDQVFAPGTCAAKYIQEFYPALSLKSAPAFAYSTITWRRPELPEALLAAPISEDATEELFAFVARALPLLKVKTALVVKIHPASNLQRLEASAAHYFGGNAQLTRRSFEDQLTTAGVLVSLGSSVVLQAAIAGVPVVIPGSQTGLTHNPVVGEELSSRCTVTYTPEDCARAIERALTARESADDVATNGELWNQYFLPATENTIETFKASLLSMGSPPFRSLN